MTGMSYFCLLTGIFVLVLGVFGTYSGEISDRYSRLIHRNQQPKKFWFTIALHYLVGVGFIGYFLYVAFANSR